MATVDTSVNELVINKLTQAQYDALTEKSPTELYFITDVDEEIADSIQVVEIPEIDDLDIGRIVQYVGETNDNYVNGYFYKLSLDASNALYVDTENMWLPDHTVTVVNANKLRNKIPNEYLANEDTIFFYYDTFENGSISAWACDLGRYDFFGPLTDDEILNDYGISIIKNGDTDPSPGDYFNVAYVAENEICGWQQIDVQPSSSGSGSSSQVVELPEVTADNLGKIVQYIGETTADYTNGYFYKIVEDYIAPVYKLASINPHEVQIVDSKVFFKFVEDTIRSQGFDGLPLNIGLHINIMFDPMFAEDGKYPVVIVSDDATVEFQVFFDKDYLLYGVGLSNNLEDFSEAVDIMVRVTEPSSTTLMWKPVDVQPTLQVVEIPEASKENIGQIVQYVGKTSADYNNGYFYKSSGLFDLTVESVVGAVWDVIEVEVNNLDLFIETFGDMLGTYTLRVGPSQSWLMERPGGTMYNATAPIDYGLAITVNGDLQTGMETTAPSGLEIMLEYTGDGFMWKQINTQPASKGDALPDQTDNAGKFLMTDGTTTSWGTTITDTLNVNVGFSGYLLSSTYPALNSTLGIRKTSDSIVVDYNEQLGYAFSFGVAYRAFYANDAWGDSRPSLGISNYKWSNVYTAKLNNGTDIEVPTTGGTMVVATPPTGNGTYVLKATVVDGVVTTEWVLEA